MTYMIKKKKRKEKKVSGLVKRTKTKAIGLTITIKLKEEISHDLSCKILCR